MNTNMFTKCALIHSWGTTKCTIHLSLSDGGFMSINIYIYTALYINPEVAKLLYNKIKKHNNAYSKIAEAA